MKLYEKLLYLVWITAMTVQAWAFRHLMKKAMDKFGLSVEDVVKGYGRMKYD